MTVSSAHPASRTGPASHPSPTSSLRSPSGTAQTSRRSSTTLTILALICSTHSSSTTLLAASQQSSVWPTPTSQGRTASATATTEALGSLEDAMTVMQFDGTCLDKPGRTSLRTSVYL